VNQSSPVHTSEGLKSEWKLSSTYFRRLLGSSSLSKSRHIHSDATLYYCWVSVRGICWYTSTASSWRAVIRFGE
jgi:hypothetical protein